MSRIVIEEVLTIEGIKNNSQMSTSGKTECPTTEACLAVNEFLDNGYKQVETFPFEIKATSNSVELSIDTSAMGPRDKTELQLRLMQFIFTEVEKVKNGY